MKILADANIEGALVKWLRAKQVDVLWACELPDGTPDTALVERANSERRILLTYDRDFGDLAIRQRLAITGVVLLRFKPRKVVPRLALLQKHWPNIEQRALNHFMVVTDSTIRVRPLV
ncbi:MAG: DUF5615 family PIN-like protein [Candidatus Hydrogenedentes bacterium]|nr:DUF5615 family PIN-like protein [Candidatus Hydrogenedentota bacterium]